MTIYIPDWLLFWAVHIALITVFALLAAALGWLWGWILCKWLETFRLLMVFRLFLHFKRKAGPDQRVADLWMADTAEEWGKGSALRVHVLRGILKRLEEFHSKTKDQESI